MFFILVSLLLASCANPGNSEKVDEIASGDTTFFYPAKEFFLEQIKSVGAGDTILNTIKKNGVTTDSVLIDKLQFSKLAYRFIENDITKKSIKLYYRQSVFLDETTGNVTFSYISTDKTLPVQSMDVLVDKQTQEVKRIFITSIRVSNGNTTMEKLGWKTGNSFFINSIKGLGTGSEETTAIMVQWRRKK